MPPRKNSHAAQPGQGLLLDARVEHLGDLRSTTVDIPTSDIFVEAPAPPPPESTPSAPDTNGLLLSALDSLAAANMRRGTRQASDAVLRKTYGTDAVADGYRYGAAYNLTFYTRKAKQQLRAALGFGPEPSADEKLSVEQLYTEERFLGNWYAFTSEYAYTEGRERRDAMRKALGKATEPIFPDCVIPESAVKLERDAEVSVEELTQDQKRDDTEGFIESGRVALMQVRLGIIGRDKRAGFMPATSREVSDAANLLKNLDKPGGAHSYVTRIYDHQHKDRPVAEGNAIGKDTVRSKLWEYGDYLANAQAGLADITVLRDVLSQHIDPTQSLYDLLGQEGYEGIDPRTLIRFIDDRTFEQGGDKQAAEAFRTKRDKRAATAEQHKVIEDAYTAADPTDDMIEHVNTMMRNLSVVEAREWAAQALVSEFNRARFWTSVISSMKPPFARQASVVLSRVS